MAVFCALFGDYLVRYYRSPAAKSAGTRMLLFLGFMAAATVLILVRCAYRVAELHEGYGGVLVREESLFIGLEGV